MTRAEAFDFFLHCFAEEKMPITLTDESITHFSKNNKPLPPELIHKFILQGTTPGEEDDEFVEYIACCKIPSPDKKIIALVYWKGDLLRHEYVLCTYTTNGVIKSRKSIAGMRITDQGIVQSVANIDTDGSIQVVVGHKHKAQNQYEPTNSQRLHLDILPSGDIIIDKN